MSGIEAIQGPKLGVVQNDNTKRNVQTAATGVGAAGVLGTMMKNTIKNTSKATKLVSQNTKEASSLLKAFGINMRKFTADFVSKMMKLQNSKFWGPIVTSPAAKKFAGIFGGLMALFVLIGEGARAIDNGRIALDDITNYRRAA